MSINYIQGTFVPGFSTDQMDEMAEMIRLDYPAFEFDPSYVVHISQFNGGIPKDRMITVQCGNWISIDRFLNYSNPSLVPDENQKKLNANVVWSLVDDRLGTYLLPFAITPGGDPICFDYARGFPPSIVLWNHEPLDDSRPNTEYIAKNFAAFEGGAD